jgi:predicted ATPase/DNA-binding SARP family transcriptional activator/DNA-binding CsgD family transcriptional regulator
MRRRPQRQVAAEQHHHQHRSPTHSPSREISSRNPEAIRIELLGGFRLRVGSRVIDDNEWRLKKAKSLVKLLALSAAHRLHREQVMEMLWPDLEPHAAANNLHQILHTLRRSLEPSALTRSSAAPASSGYLLLRDDQLTLCPDSPLWVDVEAFEEAAITARHTSREPGAYQAAIDLYAGELLPEDRYEVWVEERRAHLRELYLSLLMELASLLEERGEVEEAIEALGRVVSQEPTHEGAYVGLMRLHALLGKRREALSQYERLSGALIKKFGTEPEAATTRLQQEIWAGTFPQPESLPAGLPAQQQEERAEEVRFAAGASPRRRHNLPAALSSFVGREREILEVKRALAMTRLLTLTGTGGSGKTRLALEVAKNLVGAYPDGVWLVELAGLSEENLVPQTIAGALRVQEQPGQPLPETLAEALRSKKMLLILDNCEHLIEAVARMLDVLLGSCQHLRVLATSREALDLAGEVRWPVPPLSAPTSEDALTAEELEGYESARLFVERASNRRPGSVTTTENARAVAQICRQLEGVPLAIELAAARVGTLSVEQISERLEDSLNLLTGGGRTVVPRQQTLRGALDWSHELLDEHERNLFRKLSAFMGGWTLGAAEVVGSGGDIKEGDVLELLSNLVDKSLVVAEATKEGGVRYRMLEPVRKYAREKLKEGGETDAIQRRHAEFFLEVAEEAEPKLRGPEQGEWLERLETDHDNLRVDLRWLLEHERPEMVLRLAGALWRFWYARGYLGEGRQWLEEALALSGEATALRARVLNGAGHLAWAQGDLEQAATLREEGLKLSRQMGDKAGVAASLNGLSFVARMRGEYLAARSLAQRALAIHRELSDRWGIGLSLFLSGAAATFQGDYAAARPLLEEALAVCREVGDLEYIADSLGILGIMYVNQEDYAAARPVLEEALRIMSTLEDRRGVARCLSVLGDIALEQHEHRAARSRCEEALMMFKDLGDKWWIAWSLDGLAKVAAAQKQHTRAVRLFGSAKALRDSAGVSGPAHQRALCERYLAAARDELDKAAFAAAWDEGRKMTLEQSIEYALFEEEEQPSSATPVEEEPPPTLTYREREVAALVARGLTNRQIAQELAITERTVETHVSKVLRKLGLGSRTQIAAWAIERGPLRTDPA